MCTVCCSGCWEGGGVCLGGMFTPRTISKLLIDYPSIEPHSQFPWYTIAYNCFKSALEGVLSALLNNLQVYLLARQTDKLILRFKWIRAVLFTCAQFLFPLSPGRSVYFTKILK